MIPLLTKAAFQCMAMPDVCLLQVPPNVLVPMPFPNMADGKQAAGFSKKVKFAKKPALHVKSEIAKSKGNEASKGGVKNKAKTKACTFKTGGCSKKIWIEGKNAVRMGNQTDQNDGNAMGSVMSSSQNKVKGG